MQFVAMPLFLRMHFKFKLDIKMQNGECVFIGVFFLLSTHLTAEERLKLIYLLLHDVT